MLNCFCFLKKQFFLVIFVQLEWEICELVSCLLLEGDQGREEDVEELEIEEDVRDFDENFVLEDMFLGEYDLNEDNEFVDFDGGDIDVVVFSGDEIEF